MCSELQQLFVKVSYSSPTKSKTTKDQISTVGLTLLKLLFKGRKRLFYGFNPQKNIPLLDSKPDNVIFVDKSIFDHFSCELLLFFCPTDIFWGGFIAYKARAIFFLRSNYEDLGN